MKIVLSSDQDAFDHLNRHGKWTQLKDLIGQSELWSTESIRGKSVENSCTKR